MPSGCYTNRMLFSREFPQFILTEGSVQTERHKPNTYQQVKKNKHIVPKQHVTSELKCQFIGSYLLSVLDKNDKKIFLCTFTEENYCCAIKTSKPKEYPAAPARITYQFYHGNFHCSV